MYFAEAGYLIYFFEFLKEIRGTRGREGRHLGLADINVFYGPDGDTKPILFRALGGGNAFPFTGGCMSEHAGPLFWFLPGGPPGVVGCLGRERCRAKWGAILLLGIFGDSTPQRGRFVW